MYDMSEYHALASELGVELIPSTGLYGPFLIARRGTVSEVALGPETIKAVAQRGADEQPPAPVLTTDQRPRLSVHVHTVTARPGRRDAPYTKGRPSATPPP